MAIDARVFPAILAKAALFLAAVGARVVAVVGARGEAAGREGSGRGGAWEWRGGAWEWLRKGVEMNENREVREGERRREKRMEEEEAWEG